MMTNEYFISIYLDVRRAKKNSKYPVKLRVFTTNPRRQKLYATKYEYSKKEFNSIWKTSKPRNEYKEGRLELMGIEKEANNLARQLPYFTFEGFERLLFKKSKLTKNDVQIFYEAAISNYRKNNQLGTASNYDLSLKSIMRFHGKESLTFYEITPGWLKDYETWMLNTIERSRTTVGIYLRPLRAIFNSAIHDNVIDPLAYPFGKRKYQIPAPKSIKKALSKEHLKLLYETEPTVPEQIKAKDFWFLSYSCDGMNIKDIAKLKFKDYNGEILTYRRAKTINTKTTQLPSTVFVNDFTKKVFKKYGNLNGDPNNYIFDILEPGSDEDEQRKKIKNFTRFINQHFLKHANNCRIDLPISTYWARHSFATSLIRNGASMEHVSERMHAGNMTTTKTYFAGFEDETKKEMTEKLLSF